MTLYMLIMLVFIIPSGALAQKLLWEDINNEKQFIDSLSASSETRFTNNFENPFLLIISDNLQDEYIELGTVESKKSFIINYFKKKNPNPILPNNDLVMDLIRRMKYIVDHFKKKDPPYFDDRGKYFLKYGQPADKFTDIGGRKVCRFLVNRTMHMFLRDIYKGFPPPTNYEAYANETWAYVNISPDFVVHFVKSGAFFEEVDDIGDALITRIGKNASWYWSDMFQERGHLTPAMIRTSMELMQYEITLTTIAGGGSAMINSSSLLMPTRPIDNNRRLHEQELTFEKIDVPPSIYYPVFAENKVNLYNDIAQFRGPDGNSRIEISSQAAIEDIIENRSTETEADTITVKSQFVFRDESLDTIAKNESIKRISREQYEAAGLENIYFLKSIEIPPQQGDITVQIEDLQNRNLGYENQPFAIRDFSGDSTQISDIQFYYPAEIFSKGLLPEKEINDIAVVPFPFIKADRNSPFFIYFEIYNLDEFGLKMPYSIEITAKTDREKRGFFKKIFGGSSKEIAVSHDRVAEENDTKELLMLDLSKLDSGDYIINIDIVNPRQKDKTVSVERAVAIVGSE